MFCILLKNHINNIMKFKTGDKVKFLNRVGGGYVTKVLANSMVKVMVEGGFEYPVLENELILIDPKSSLERYFDEDFNVPKPDRKPQVEEYELNRDLQFQSKESKEKERDKDFIGEIKLIDNPDGDKLDKGLILAFIPKSQLVLTKDELTVSIINYTDYTIYYNIYQKKSLRKFIGLDVDKISPFSRINLCIIKREDLVNWLSCVFQALFSTKSAVIVPNPINTEINLKLSHFDIKDNYRTSNIMTDKAMLIMLDDIYYNEKLNTPKEEKNKDIIIAEEKLNAEATAIPVQLIDRHKTDKRKAEVDLHISALRKDYSNLKSGEIISIQKQYFIDALENGIMNHYKEIVFIHGIGNGVLKEILLNILKTDYDDLAVYNAPFNKYGNGAIVVEVGD